ncbi:uncharacterized protein LOC135391842 [Ornithodoros turicata]|uniref:uncharacterized protein LOC135391842 n=1 Tax=Ornithodoros turicata TaxID=34597 RepID=UPI00313978B6
MMFLKRPSRRKSAASLNGYANGLRSCVGKRVKMAEMGDVQLRPRDGRDSSFQARVHFRKSQSGMPKMEGYLRKRTTKLNLKWFWRKFWFVLDGKSLLYFKSQSNYKALGTCRGLIDFGLVQAVRSTHESKKCYGLEIVTYSDIIYLSANDKDTRDIWVAALQGAIGVGEVSWPFGVQLSNNTHLKELRDEGTSDRPGPQCPSTRTVATNGPKAVQADVHRAPSPAPRKNKSDNTQRPSSDMAVPAKKNTLRRIRSFSFGKLKKSRLQGFFRQLSGKETRLHQSSQEAESMPVDDAQPQKPLEPRDAVEDVSYDVGYATIGEPDPDYDRGTNVTTPDVPPDENATTETFRVSVRIPVISYYSEQDDPPVYGKINKQRNAKIDDIQEEPSGEGVNESTTAAVAGDACNIYTDSVTHVTEIYCSGPQRRHSFTASSDKQNGFPVYQKVNKRCRAQRRFSLDEVFGDRAGTRDTNRTQSHAFYDSSSGLKDCSRPMSHEYESCSFDEVRGSTQLTNSEASDSTSAHVYQELEDMVPDSMYLPRAALRSKRCVVDEDTECYYSSISEEDLRETTEDRGAGEYVVLRTTRVVQTQTSLDSETADDSTYETATLNNSSLEELPEMEYFEDNPHIMVTRSELYVPPQENSMGDDAEEVKESSRDEDVLMNDAGSSFILREMENLLIHGH